MYCRHTLPICQSPMCSPPHARIHFSCDSVVTQCVWYLSLSPYAQCTKTNSASSLQTQCMHDARHPLYYIICILFGNTDIICFFTQTRISICNEWSTIFRITIYNLVALNSAVHCSSSIYCLISLECLIWTQFTQRPLALFQPLFVN